MAALREFKYICEDNKQRLQALNHASAVRADAQALNVQHVDVVFFVVVSSPQAREYIGESSNHLFILDEKI